MNKTIIIAVAFALIFGGVGYYLGYDHGWERLAGRDSESVATTEVPNQKRAAPTQEDLLLGTWRSTEDAKFTRTFRANGSSEDKYQGDELATQVGDWETFTSANPDPYVGVDLRTDTTYLKIHGQYEVLFFSIDELTENRLELTYLANGNRLTFTKVR